MLKLVKTVVAHILGWERGVVSGVNVGIYRSADISPPLVFDLSLPHHHIDIFLQFTKAVQYNILEFLTILKIGLLLLGSEGILPQVVVRMLLSEMVLAFQWIPVESFEHLLLMIVHILLRDKSISSMVQFRSAVLLGTIEVVGELILSTAFEGQGFSVDD